MRRIIAATAALLIVTLMGLAAMNAPAGAEGTYAPPVDIDGIRVIGLARNASCSITRTYVSIDGQAHRVETNQRDHWTRSSGVDVPAGGQATFVVNGDYVAPYLVRVDGGRWVDLGVPDHGDAGKDCGDASSTSTTSPPTTSTTPPTSTPPSSTTSTTGSTTTTQPAPPTTPAPPTAVPPATSVKAPPTPSTSPSTEVTLPATGGRGSGTGLFALALIAAGVVLLCVAWRVDLL